MNLQFRLLQYREDIDRQEGRNFALIVYDGAIIHLRAIGLDRDGTFSIQAYNGFSSSRPDSTWVFGEWIGWLKAYVESADREDLEQALDRLERQDLDIVPTPLRMVDDLAATSSEEAISDLEKRVLIGVRRSPQTFAERVERFLERTKLIDRKGFERNAEIEFTPKESSPLVASFPFIVMEEPRLAFKVIAYTGRKDHLTRQVNDALLSFEKAVEAGFVTPNNCIVLTEKMPPKSERYTKNLGSVAKLVNVGDEEASFV